MATASQKTALMLFGLKMQMVTLYSVVLDLMMVLNGSLLKKSMQTEVARFLEMKQERSMVQTLKVMKYQTLTKDMMKLMSMVVVM